MIRKPWLTVLLLGLFVHEARGQADSLIRVHDTATGSDLRSRLSAKISVILSDNNPGESFSWAKRGFGETSGNASPALASCANQIGAYYKDRSMFDSAAYYYKIALDAGRQLRAQRIINGMQANLGQLYSLKGDFPEALKYQLPALAYYEAAGDAEMQNRYISTLSIGNTYYHMHQPQKALAYYDRIYPALKDGRQRAAAGVFTGMALCYGDLGDTVQEERLLQKALNLKKASGDSLGIAQTLSNLGNAAYHRHNHEAAIVFYNQALQIAQRTGNNELVDECRQNIATAQMQHGNSKGAIRQFTASLAAAKAAGNLRIEKIALQNLIGIYDSLHDYASAYKYITEYDSVADTARSQNYIGAIADAETRYNTQRALRDRDRLSYEGRIQSAARARALRERNTAIAVGLGCVAALALIFLLALRIRTIRATTKEEQRATRSIFEGEQAERIRIARDLHDSIGQMLAVMKMRLTSQPQDDLENKTIITNLVDKTIDEVRAISHNLIPEDLTFGTVRALENLCARMAQNSGIAVQFLVDDAVRAHRFNQEFGLSLYRIVQEVLGNIMKHSGASEISLSMSQVNSAIVLQIEDNGKGFDTAAIGESTGIGWKNIYARVGLLNGVVDVRSERISGTRIHISIPQ